MNKLLFEFSKNDYFIIRNDCPSLKALCEKYGTPPKVIIKLNNLVNEPEENDILLLRKLKGKLYVVKPFDTLSMLSAYSKISEEELLFLNCTKNIAPYDIIELP